MAQHDFPQSQRIVYLMSRYISGLIDFGELQELDNWKKESEGNAKLFEELLDEANQKQAIARMQGYDSKATLQKLRQAIVTSQKVKSIRRLWIRIAAAGTVLFVVGIFALFILKQKDVNLTTSLKPHPQYVPPGTDKAILTLANGKKVIINPKSSGLIAMQGGIQVSNAKGGTLVYRASGETNSNMHQYNTIETPRAGKYSIQLPDGTKVWLNAASSLRYPVAFKGNIREVILSGEGYFEVAKDKTKPFIVQAAGQKVTVLGTHFNINAYNDEPQITTTLVEGSVHVEGGGNDGLLKPGQHSLFAQGKFKIEKADVYSATAWKSGQLAFLRTDLKAVLRQVSRWYDIDIEYQGTVPSFTISGDVSRDADLSAMLEILKLYNVQFIQQGRKLIIMDHNIRH